MNKIVYSLIGLQTFCFASGLFGEEAAEGPPVRDQGFTQTLLMIGVALVFFYFILWRPEQKRRKVMEEQRSAMKKGDKVTAMGIVGTVIRTKDTTVILQMVDGSKIEFLKAAITDVTPGTEEDVKRMEKVDKEEKV